MILFCSTALPSKMAFEVLVLEVYGELTRNFLCGDCTLLSNGVQFLCVT